MRRPRSKEPGQQLRVIRERLGLKYRDVFEASRKVAKEHANPEFVIGLSRLADIENKGTVPSLYRLYSLAAVYAIDLTHLMAMFGVNTGKLPADSSRLEFAQTREACFPSLARGSVEIPAGLLDRQTDWRATSYISRQIHRWGKLPLALVEGLDLRRQRYAFVGSDDWSMHPVIRPGSFIQIDEAKRNIKRDTFLHELEKPIYFLEHRAGFRCGWCTLTREKQLIVQSHPASAIPPEMFKYPGEVDIVGQVVAVAMRLDLERRRRIRS